MKLLIKFPTRGRREKFFSVLDKYYSNLSDLDNTTFLISLDKDDTQMNNTEVVNKLKSYKKLYFQIC